MRPMHKQGRGRNIRVKTKVGSKRVRLDAGKEGVGRYDAQISRWAADLTGWLAF